MDSWYLLLAFLFVLANGFFVAAEFAIVKVRSTQLTELAEQGSVRAKMARKLTRHLDSYLSATQLGITLASLALGWIGEPAFEHLLEPLFVRFGGAGEAFDPTVHEALLHTEWDDAVTPADPSATTIVQVLQPGYRTGKHVIRPARVSVADPA